MVFLTVTLFCDLGRFVHADEANIKISQLSQDKLWLRLLHLASKETKVLSTGFYLSPRPLDLKAELTANLRQAQKDPQYRCRFPARNTWLRSHFSELNFVSRGPCDELDAWRAEQAVDSISLVYPDRNMDTSLGIFSHTFLKFNLSQWSIHSNLNVALGFAAELNPNETLVRMVSMGLFGGYVAKFSFSNYYSEVNRYGESESRDIFEYDLLLNKSEIDFLLDHLWELQDVEFQYFFLNGNCSYHLLTLLEIARPELDLTSHFNFVTVPSTSLKEVLAQKNLVGTRRWIPGKQTRENTLLAKLSPRGRSFYRKWRWALKKDGFSDALQSEKFSVDEETMILDVLAETLRGEKERELLRNEILNRRSLLPPEKGPPENFYPSENPETAHGVELIGGALGQNAESSRTWAQFRYRVALHNMLDPSSGYFKNSSFELGDLRLRYSSDRQFEDSSVTLVNAIILRPWTEDHQSVSWQGRSRVLDFLKTPRWQNSGGLGGAMDFSRSTWYSMVIADSYLDKAEKLGLGVFAGLTLGTVVNVFDSFTIKGSLDRLWPLQSEREEAYYQGEFQAAFSGSTNWSLQIGLVSSWRERSLLLETLYYY